jgi:hypothetical protein
VTLTAFGLNCSLKSSTEPSSTDKLLDEVLAELAVHDVSTSGTVRIADCVVRAGVSSDAQRVLERLDAFLDETDDKGRMVSLDRVAIVAVVGDEDGAHHVAAAANAAHLARLFAEAPYPA